MKDFLKHWLDTLVMSIIVGIVIGIFIFTIMFIENNILLITCLAFYIVTLTSILTYRKSR